MARETTSFGDASGQLAPVVGDLAAWLDEVATSRIASFVRSLADQAAEAAAA